MWENEIQVYELQKGDSGLGFSILDYQVYVCLCTKTQKQEQLWVWTPLELVGESQLFWNPGGAPDVLLWNIKVLLLYIHVYYSIAPLSPNILYACLSPRCHFLKLSQDPMNPGRTVIVIRSLVAGGLAERDGRLLPGDRLMFVNGTDLSHASLAEAVHVLKSTALGTVRIGVSKPLPVNISLTSKSRHNAENVALCKFSLLKLIFFTSACLPSWPIFTCFLLEQLYIWTN